MKLSGLHKLGEDRWHLEPHGEMRVPVVFYASETLLKGLEDNVLRQACNVTTLPGIVGACYVMPDAHWGYGFPIGAVAAFDAAEGGVVAAGGIGFDVSCGVRLLHTGLRRAELAGAESALADTLFASIPAGVGSRGRLRLEPEVMDAMLEGGARWAVERGYGRRADLERIEEGGCMAGADPDAVSPEAKRRQRDEAGTLGSGNHYLEVQCVDALFDEAAARAFGLAPGDVVLSIHCGSRGLGHQLGTDYMREMLMAAGRHGLRLVDRELAAAPLDSELGRRYLGGMRAAVNSALANRQVLTQLAREAFGRMFPGLELPLIYDVSHNTCKEEAHLVNGERRRLHLHRKGATRALGPGHAELPAAYRPIGQPVVIGGSMGTASYVLAGNTASEALSFASACHGAGRAMSRHEALRRYSGKQIVASLAERGTLVRSLSLRGVAEEAPGAYKDVEEVVATAERAGLARRVARLTPLVVIKG